MNDGDVDLGLFGSIARMLVELDEIPDPAAFKHPYPLLAQRTLNEVVLRCLLDEAKPPNSLPGMVKWCHERSLPQWPLATPEGLFDEESFLLDGEAGVLTELCYELALVSASSDPLRKAVAVVDEAALAARMQRDQASYKNLRRLLAQRPVLDNAGLTEAWCSSGLGQLDTMIPKLYHQVPIRFYDRGVCRSCPGCGHLMMPLETDWWCERRECRIRDAGVTGRVWAAPHGELSQLDRWHRQFVGAPGRVTLALFERLSAMGLSPDDGEVELWPDFGACDLKISFPDGQTWGLRVVDWENPALLGHATGSLSGSVLPVDAAVWVVPDHRVMGNPGYRDSFADFAGGAARGALLRTCDQVLSEARSRLGDLKEW